MAYEMSISYWSSDVCSSDLLDAGGVRSSVGLAEQLAPDDLLVERWAHPAVELVLVAVLDDREDVPGGDAVGRLLDAGGGELLLEHEQLDGAGLAALGIRPLRPEVGGLDPPGALHGDGEVLDAY